MAVFTFVRRSLRGGGGLGHKPVSARHVLVAMLVVVGLGWVCPWAATAGPTWCGNMYIPPGPPPEDCTAIEDPGWCDSPCPCEGEDGTGDGGGGEGASGPPSSNVGPAMHVHVATGNVWTTVPVVRADMADRPALNFYLRYDSSFAKVNPSDQEFRPLLRNTVLGPGWTHSYNAYAFKGDYWDYAGLMVINSQGRRQLYEEPPGDGDSLGSGIFSWLERVDATQYRVHYQNGTYEEYTLIQDAEVGGSDVLPEYMADIEDVFTTRNADESGNWFHLTKVVDRRGRVTELTYDASTGLLSKIQGPYWGAVITLDYVSGTELLEHIHHPDERVTDLSYTNGRLTGVEDPEENSRTYEYSSAPDYVNNITSETLRNGTKYIVWYGDNSVVIRDTHADGSEDSGYVVVEAESVGGVSAWDTDIYVPSDQRIYTSGIKGGTVTVTVPIGPGDSRVWTYTVGVQGRVTSVEPPSDGDDSTSRTITNTYDTNTNAFPAGAGSHTLTGTGTGRLRARQVGDDAKTYYAYHAENGKIVDIVDAEGHRTSYEYTDNDWPGFVSKKIEPDGDEWSYRYVNNTGDLYREDFSTNGTEGISHTIRHVTYGYPTGRPGLVQYRTTTDIHDNTTRWNFDTNGAVDTIVADQTDLAVTTSYTHDVMGRLRSRTQQRDTDPDVEVEYFYDDAGRLVRTVVDSNGLALETLYELDGEGRLIGVTDPGGLETTYRYNRRNQLTHVIVDSNGLALTTEYVYDKANHLAQTIDPKGNTTDIAYYNFGLARLITDPARYDTELTWDALGNLGRIERQLDAASNGFAVTALDYDNTSRVVSITVDPEGKALETTFAYAEDAGGGGCGCSGTPGSGLPQEVTDPAGKLDSLVRTPVCVSG